MSKPVRLQLSRHKGFNLQLLSHATNGLPAVNVARPGRWGNPFSVGKAGPMGRFAGDATAAVGFFREMLDDVEMWAAIGYPTDLSALRGRNLACWCGPAQACHAEVLLDLANDRDAE